VQGLKKARGKILHGSSVVRYLIWYAFSFSGIKEVRARNFAGREPYHRITRMNNHWLIRLKKQGKYFFDLITRDELKTNLLQALPFWIASLITGLIAVLYSRLFGYCEHLLQLLLGWNKLSIFIVTPLAMLAAWYTIRLSPLARGSGIPQVMAAIEIAGTRQEEKTDSLLNLRIILVKVCSSLLMVLGGAAIGREGPTIQIAGSVFRTVNKWLPESWPQLSRKSFILTGAAAGLAAAFNTPLGGIVFAIEELAKVHLSYFRTALFTAVIIAGLTAQGFLGPYLYLGYPDVSKLPAYIYAGVIIVAIISGLMGAFMGKLILRMMRWKHTFGRIQIIVLILTIGLITATSYYFIDAHTIGSGKELMNQFLFTGNKQAPLSTVLVRFFGPALAFNVSAAGGVFAPSLAAGASVGAFICHLFHVANSHANILILSGMVGFLCGVTRSPFTSAILVLEMTDRHSVIFHLMLAALVSNLASLVIDEHSLYERLKEDYVKEVTDEEDNTAFIEQKGLP